MQKRTDRQPHLSRRSFLLGVPGLIGAMAFNSPTAWRVALAAGSDGFTLETVLGPVSGADIEKALAHEHLYVDFHGPTASEYMNVDWQAALGASVSSATELRQQGVNLLIDWTNLGVGRNVLLLRNVARWTGMHIVCPTGIYKNLVPPAMNDMSVAEIADYFRRELMFGIDGTGIRAGFVKISTTEVGATEPETKLHRAAAIAAREAGCTIALHSPQAPTTWSIVEVLESEGFDLERFVWGHAQPSSTEDHLKMLEKGATVQFDAIGADSDPFFDGPTDDSSMLKRIGNVVDAGHADRVIVSADASVFVNPPKWQYDRDNTYVYRYFEDKLAERLGTEPAARVLRDNVIRAFRRGDHVG